MKMKLSTLAFGLLLAVGWTGSAFAQSQEEPFKAAEAKTWTYSWTDAQGTTHDNVDPTLKVTDPYQMYYLLRHVYMDERFPGPFYSAYKADGTTRERPVYYGGIDSGWDIPGTAIPDQGTTTTIQVPNYSDVVIHTGTSTGSYVNYSRIYSIKIVSGSTTISSWDYATNSNVFPDGWSLNGSWSITSDGYLYTSSASNTLTFSGEKLKGYTDVEVQIRAYDYSYYTSGYRRVYVNGNYENLESSLADYSWSLTPSSYTTETVEGGIGDIVISGTNRNAVMTAITVTSGSTTLFNWSWAASSMNYPAGMQISSWSFYHNLNYGLRFNSALNPITLEGWLFEGYSSVTVTISAFTVSSATENGILLVNGDSKEITGSGYSNVATYTWTVNARQFDGPPTYQADQYKPNKEGYTALVVKVKDNPYHAPDAEGFGHHQSFYESKDSIISYLSRDVESIQLLTDGLVIGEGDQIGTVFNAPIDEYNKFFFLSKGQARQKSDIVVQEQRYKEHLLGEQVPFAQMFEQFSPTGGKDGDQITDFYSEMIQGKVYRIVHDCLSVIQNGHQFSMSGNTGSTRYKMSGMNFFIPDHRLQYWELTDTLKRYKWDADSSKFFRNDIVTYTVDGRDMNPYQPASSTKTNDHSTFYTTPSQVAVWYAQYDTAQHAPLVGLYLINLNAQANPYPNYDEDHRYYQSTLDWTSSLNEMSGNGVSQTYIIYQVTTDPVTGEVKNVPIDTVKNSTDFHPQLTLDTLYQQQAHSYTITYVIQGSPTDSEHPGFVAWSNTATVIIPGYDDFMVLDLHHYESDFVVNQERNYYRNYMQPVNDFANGITAESIRNGYDSFILYRNSTDGKVPVAKLKLAVDSNNRVLYKITYFDENEDYNEPNYDNTVLPTIINQLLNKQ